MRDRHLPVIVLLALATAFSVLAAPASAQPLAAAATVRATRTDPTISLPTGERVWVRTIEGREIAGFADPDASGRVIRFGTHTWVIPDAAMPGLISGRYDAARFRIDPDADEAGEVAAAPREGEDRHALRLRVFSKPDTPATAYAIVMNVDDSRLFFTDLRIGTDGSTLQVPTGDYFVVALSDTRLVTAEIPVRRDRGARLDLYRATVRPRPTYAGHDLVATAFSLTRQPVRGVGLRVETSGRGRYYVSAEETPEKGRLSSAIGPTFADVRDDGSATSLAVARRQYPGIPRNLSPALDPSTFTEGTLDIYGHGGALNGFGGTWGFLPSDFFAYNAYVPLKSPGSIPFAYSGPRVWRWLTDLFVFHGNEGEGKELDIVDLSADPVGRDGGRLAFLRSPIGPGRDTGGSKHPGGLCTMCVRNGRLTGRIPLIGSPGTSQLGNPVYPGMAAWRLLRGSRVLDSGDYEISPRRIPVNAGDRLTIDAQMTPGIEGWTLGDHATSTWSFTVPDGDASMPLLRARWILPTRLDGRIRAGAHVVRFPVSFDSMSGPGEPQVRSTRWGYRVDDGSWRPAKVRRTGAASFVVAIPNPDSGRVSVRMTAVDAGGSRVAEQIDHAWAVARR